MNKGSGTGSGPYPTRIFIYNDMVRRHRHPFNSLKSYCGTMKCMPRVPSNRGKTGNILELARTQFGRRMDLGAKIFELGPPSTYIVRFSSFE